MSVLVSNRTHSQGIDWGAVQKHPDPDAARNGPQHFPGLKPGEFVLFSWEFFLKGNE